MDLHPRWNQGGSAARAAFFFESVPSLGPLEMIAVRFGSPAQAELALAALDAGAPVLVSTLLDDVKLIESGNGTLAGRAATRVVVDASKGVLPMRVEETFLVDGDRAIFVSIAHERDARPSEALSRARPSLSLTAPTPSDACPPPAPVPDATPASGTSRHANGKLGWAFEGPANWTSEPLSPGGEAILFLTPEPAEGDPYRESVIVAVKESGGLALDEIVPAMNASLSERVEDYAVVGIYEGELAGVRSALIDSREAHGVPVAALRVLAVVGSDLYYVEALYDPMTEAGFVADLERLLETFEIA